MPFRYPISTLISDERNTQLRIYVASRPTNPWPHTVKNHLINFYLMTKIRSRYFRVPCLGRRGVFEILIAKAPTFIEFSVGTTLLAPKGYHKSLEFKYDSLYMHFRAFRRACSMGS